MRTSIKTDAEIGYAFTPSRGALVASYLAATLAKQDGANAADVAGCACLVAELAGSMVTWRCEGSATPKHRSLLRETLARYGAKLIERRAGDVVELYARIGDEPLIRLA
jgi:hypothetical protein